MNNVDKMIPRFCHCAHQRWRERGGTPDGRLTSGEAGGEAALGSENARGAGVLKAPCNAVPQEQPGLPASEVHTDPGEPAGVGSAQRPLRQCPRAGAALQLAPAARAGRRAPGPAVPGGHAEPLPWRPCPLPFPLRAKSHWPEPRRGPRGGQRERLPTPPAMGLRRATLLVPFWVPGFTTMSGSPPLALKINKLSCVSSVLSGRPGSRLLGRMRMMDP